MFKQKIALVFAWLFMWPLVLFYVSCSQKKNILEDIEKNMSFRNATFTGLNAIVYVLFLDKFYRTLFYYRIGKKSFLIKWLWRGDNSFSITTGRMDGGACKI